MASDLNTKKEGHQFKRMENDVRQVHDSLTEMIKQLANEPSLGLYFVQQHVHKVVPSVISLKAQLVNGSQEAVLCTEDVKDSLTAVRTMKNVGPSAIENMRAMLNSSLLSLQQQQNVKRSTSQLGLPILEGIDEMGNVKGGIASLDASSVENTTSTTCNFPTISERRSETGSSSYIRSTFGSVLQKASTIGWKTSASQVDHDSQADTSEMAEVGSFLSTTAEALTGFAMRKPALYIRAAFDSKRQVPDIEGKDGEKAGCSDGLEASIDMEEVGSSLYAKTLIVEDTYKQFQEEHRAKLEAWLENTDGPTST